MRSLLFVPGDDEKKLAKALSKARADALIVDLKDSVAPDRQSRPPAAWTAAFLRAGAAGARPALA